MSRNVASALFLALSLGFANVSQALEIQWVENSSPATPFPAADPLNNAPFNGVQDLENSAPNEFRLMNSGFAAGGGEKSVVATPVTWVFDDTSGELLSVRGTPDTRGGSLQPLNPGVGTPGTGLFLNASPFLIPSPDGDFGFLAPTLGSDAGSLHGVATISRTDLTSNGPFTIHFPVLESHWATSISTIGSAGGGVDFNCDINNGSVSCTADYQILLGEDSIGFVGQYVQFDLKGITDGAVGPFVLADIDVDGGLLRECTVTNGDQVAVSARIVLGGGARLGTVEWFVDGEPAAMGEATTLFVPLGENHTIDLTVTADTGETASDSVALEVKDTRSPGLEVAFLDARTGEVVTEVVGGQQVQVSVVASDDCDPNPKTDVDIVPIYKAQNGEVIKIKSKAGKLKLNADGLKLDGVAEDAAGHKGRDSTVLTIIGGLHD